MCISIALGVQTSYMKYKYLLDFLYFTYIICIEDAKSIHKIRTSYMDAPK